MVGHVGYGLKMEVLTTESAYLRVRQPRHYGHFEPDHSFCVGGRGEKMELSYG